MNKTVLLLSALLATSAILSLTACEDGYKEYGLCSYLGGCGGCDDDDDECKSEEAKTTTAAEQHHAVGTMNPIDQ